MNLHIVDMFWTFQGEGLNTGRRALFVRMPFCNLKCPWCDTEFDKFNSVSEPEFIKMATTEKARFAVITGGEPTLHKHSPRVIYLLKSLGFEIAMESNGTSIPLGGVDHLTVSPKRYSKTPFEIHPQSLDNAAEFKYVVEDGFPFQILDRHSLDSRPKYLSPEFGRMKESLKEIEKYIAAHPEWKVSLQSHKWMGIK